MASKDSSKVKEISSLELSDIRPLRYNIIIRIAAFDRKRQAKIKQMLQQKMCVSERTLGRWLYIKKDDNSDIPGVALRHFAIYLNTTIEELFNDLNE